MNAATAVPPDDHEGKRRHRSRRRAEHEREPGQRSRGLAALGVGAVAASAVVVGSWLLLASLEEAGQTDLSSTAPPSVATNGDPAGAPPRGPPVATSPTLPRMPMPAPAPEPLGPPIIAGIPPLLPDVQHAQPPPGAPAAPGSTIPDAATGTAPPPVSPASQPPPPPSASSLAWNTWLSRAGRLADPAALEPGRDYTVHLDLAALSYEALDIGRVASGTPDPQLRLAVAEALAAREPELRLRLRAVAIGASLADAAQREIRLTVDLRRAEDVLGRLQQELASAPVLAATVRARGGDAAGVEELSAALRVTAEPVALDLHTGDAGCGALAVSVWDEQGRRPLDHLVQRFAIGGATAGGPCVLPSAADRPLSAGFGTFLQRVAAMPDNPFDAALHVFDVALRPSGDAQSVVVFVDGRNYKPEAPGQPLEARGVYAWVTRGAVADYAVRHLPARVGRARQAATSGTVGAYAEAGDELARKLFENGETAGDRAVAGRAAAALKALAPSTVSRATLLVRLIGADRDLVYAPVGILSARGPKQVVTGTLTVVQPLPIERPVSRKSCVAPWVFGVPEELDGGGTHLQGVSFSAADWMRGPLARLDALAGFLRAGAELDADALPEGVLLLAHHDEGKLWFTDQDADMIHDDDIARAFPPGSVAVLAACSTSARTPESRRLLNRLNINGIDAVVSSPFPVPVAFGVPFAVAFGQLIQDVRGGKLEGRGWTLDRLLALATDRTVAQLGGEPTLADMAHEFQILGDPSIEICPYRQ